MHVTHFLLPPPPTMSLPYIAALTSALFLINVWWDRRWKLRNLPIPVCYFLYLLLWPLLTRFDPILTHRLVPLSSGATKSLSSKMSKAINGVPGSTNVVEPSRSKPPGATQKLYGGRAPVFHLRTAPIYTDCDHFICLHS